MNVHCTYDINFNSLIKHNFLILWLIKDHLCGLVAWVRFVALRKKKVVGLERGPLSLVSTTEELLDRKVAAPV
jgi:hypothetical protein